MAQIRISEGSSFLLTNEKRDADTAPPFPENPVSRIGDLWICGAKNPHRILCGDSTSAEAVARLLGDRRPRLMVTDPPYGIELDSEWRDREAVYEPFLGSGTTLAAETTDRVRYGMELDTKYVDVSVQRWQTLSGKQAILDGDGPTLEAVAEERRRAAV